MEVIRYGTPNGANREIPIIPLGGLGEIGKNMTIFQYEDEIIVLDSGLAFPSEDMLGVDIVIPDMSYIIENKDRVKAVVITHVTRTILVPWHTL